MVKAKSGLVGHYEMVRLTYVNDTFVDRRMLIVEGTMARMCEFYESLKDAMEASVNADSKKFGYSDATGEHHYEYTDEELDNWRTEPNEIAAYEKAKKDGLREGVMRFMAEETRFVFDDSPRSWVKALEAAIVSSGIEVEKEPLAV